MRRAAHPWDRFYRDHAAPWRGERSVADLAAWLGAGPIVELGCGNGKMLRPLLAAGHDAVGLDISWHAVRRLGEQGRGRAPVAAADASRLPIADGAAACVLDIHCTGHLNPAGRVAAWRDAFRALAPGGHLIVERLAEDDLRAGQGDAVQGDAGTRRLQDGRTTHFATRDALETALTAAGFTVVDATTVRRHPRLRGREVIRSSHRLVGRKAD